MRKSWSLFLSLFLLVFLFFLLKDEGGMKPDILLKGNSFIEGMRIIYKKNGARNWTLTAKRADISDEGNKAYLTDVAMTLETRGLTLYADRGLYRMTDKTLTVDGKIIARGETYAITSAGGEFDNGNSNFRTGGEVRIDSRKFTVQGRGMNIDGSGQKVRILRDVKAVFYN